MTHSTKTLVWAMAVIVAIAALKLGETFAGPVVVALVCGVILSPMANGLQNIGLRPAASSLLTVLIGVACAAMVAFFIEPYIARAIEMAPRIWFEFRSTIESIRRMLLGIDEIVEQVATTVDPGGKGETTNKTPIDVPSSADALIVAPRLLGQVMTFIGVLYFFLMTRHEVFSWLGRIAGGLDARDFEFAEKQVARYFLTIAAINAVFGVIVGVAMQLLGMPAPIMWGVVAFLANFIIYLGPMAVTGALFIVGVVTFDGAMSFVPAAVFLSANALEGQFITPHLVGRQMSVNPLSVFVSIVFWMWLWGPLGGFIAIPILVWSLALTERFQVQPPDDRVGAAPARVA